MNGDNFAKSMMEPISPALVQSGWPIDTVFGVAVKAINGLYASSGAETFKHQGDPNFYKVLRLLRELQLSDSIGFRMRTDKGGEEHLFFSEVCTLRKLTSVTSCLLPMRIYSVLAIVVPAFVGSALFFALDCLGLVENSERLSATKVLIREVKHKTGRHCEERIENAEDEVSPTGLNACEPQGSNRPVEHDRGRTPKDNPKQAEETAEVKRDF